MTNDIFRADAERAAHWERVRRQYDDLNGATFYRTVMGGGGDHIHFGRYESETESPREATRRATQSLIELVARNMPLDRNTRVVDFGSGNGGPAHQLILERSVRMTCVNLCPRQNAANCVRAAELGIADRLSIEECSFESPPAAWTAMFDVVWCQESLCHAADKGAAAAEAFRVLRPGGVLVVSDILAGDRADVEQLKSFTDRNAVVRLDSRERYLEFFRRAGFEIAAELDWTEHLPTNFAHMLREIQKQYDELVAAGVERRYLDDFADALRQRTASASDHVFRWGVFVARKLA